MCLTLTSIYPRPQPPPCPPAPNPRPAPPLQDAILKLGPLPRLLNDISVALRNPQLHMPTNHQPERPKDRPFTRPSFNRLMSSDFQSLMMRDLNRYAEH